MVHRHADHPGAPTGAGHPVSACPDNGGRDDPHHPVEGAPKPITTGRRIMQTPVLIFESVTYTYPGSPEPAVRDISFTAGTGWTSLAGANGSGKTTLLKLATGLLVPDGGRITSSGLAIYCVQRTDHPPEGFTRFVRDWLDPGLMAEMGIEWDWPERWSTLSHGERKRAQLALALSISPGILAVDEPVNHLDRQGRTLVEEALSRFEGIGLLVTHDRELMDALSSRCGILHGDGLEMRRGGYTAAHREETLEQQALREARRQAAGKARRLRTDARRKQLTARTLQARSSGRKLTYREICISGVDGPSRIDSSVQKAGQLARTAQARARRATEEMGSIRFRKQTRTGIDMKSELSRRNFLMEIAPGSMPVGNRVLNHPEIVILPRDRIALTGPNGSGKSTLVRAVVERLELPEGRLLYIPQELTAEESAEALSRARELETEELGRVMTGVRRLGSDPAPLLGSSRPSPGETRKLLLCLGLLAEPWLVIMDEPTNHLDLPGIECLEEALGELRCALLLVSHDRRFLERTTITEWRITAAPEESILGVIRGSDGPRA